MRGIEWQEDKWHALVWKLAQSPKVEKIYVAPGNPGMLNLAECINLPASDFESVAAFAMEKKIDLTVVGPEGPLVAGIVDVFKAHVRQDVRNDLIYKNQWVDGSLKPKQRAEAEAAISKGMLIFASKYMAQGELKRWKFTLP